MWCAVLEVSFGDAVAHVCHTTRRGNTSGTELLYAHNFITKWNQTFDAICLLAGMDATWFREQAIKRLEAIKDGTDVGWRYNPADLEATAQGKRKKIKKLDLLRSPSI